jgi:hypothetical protein
MSKNPNPKKAPSSAPVSSENVETQPSSVGESTVVTLTESEQNELSGYEATIAKQKVTFLEVGFALKAIQEKKLYAGYATFETYCSEKWDFGPSYAYKLVKAAEIAATLKNAGAPEITNEHQARLLNRAGKAKCVEVMLKAAGLSNDGIVRSTHIEQAIQTIMGGKKMGGKRGGRQNAPSQEATLGSDILTRLEKCRGSLKELIKSREKHSGDCAELNRILRHINWVLKSGKAPTAPKSKVSKSRSGAQKTVVE